MRGHNDSVEIIWDDGLIMEGLWGLTTNKRNNISKKQISSFPVKQNWEYILEIELEFPLGQPVRRHHLERYGRTDIEISLLADGVYQFDFSVWGI
jgi:hypothetical protein